MADLSGAWFATIAILAALRAREKHGIGQYIDVALADTSYALMQSRMVEYLVNDCPSKEVLMARPGIGLFETRDGSFISIGAAENHFWRSLCTVLGLAEWGLAERFATSVGRRHHGREIREKLRASFLQENSAHWLKQLRDAGVPCAQVNDLGAAARDPHAVARKIIEWTDHPDFGTIPSVRFPPIMSATPATTRMRAPMLGEHTDALLAESGYSAEEIRQLHDAHAV